MIMLNIILSVFGVIFFIFGFLVSFKKKYGLVSVFTRSSRANDTNYPEQIGLISLMSGMLYIFAGIVGLVSSSLIFTACLFALCLIVTAALFLHSSLKANKA